MAEEQPISQRQTKPLSYREELKQNISQLIEQLDLSSLQKQFMKSRWLDQLMWLEGRAERCRNRHHKLRLITIVGGVLLPALISLNSSLHPRVNQCEPQPDASTPTTVASQPDWMTWLSSVNWLTWFTFGLSQAVAISAAVEEFFHYGESYRQYRNTAEIMKIEGWQFFQLTGRYSNEKSHSEAYSDFAMRVEGIIQQDVEGYLAQTQQSQEKAKQNVNVNLDQ
ncbi:conserved hypothetical protein [Gloeothece citriformis PCC 7424]|uniref:DUF4231 domain-containing protein n=1 Tax=Gloeothece citriformis (strain PCC 7424) TaxID=65393 RepID=B7K8D7_GLOC7|nr:DUF4231 domain-containing protein [Gloeothece citriformis]ACK69897.1 conserved hypothetical protein [Gloeothece citriformis PCC 7424]